MFAVLSPAKKLDFESEVRFGATSPQLLAATRELSETTKKLSAKELGALMKLSPALSKLNFERFTSMDLTRARPTGSRPAALAFDGDTYIGLKAPTFSAEDMEFAQTHLGILSGFYGLLRPLDAILPYRLEMGARLATSRGKTLYDFWGDRVAEAVNKAAKKLGTDVLLNLASQEYFTVLDRPSLKLQVITPDKSQGRWRLF